MRQMSNWLRWQVAITIMALVLIPHPIDGAKNPDKKKTCFRNKKGVNYIQVRVDKAVNRQVDVSEIRSFPQRNIVPFRYKHIMNPQGYPERIMEVVCSNKCMGNEMNVAQIKRNIPYLKREGDLLVLGEMAVTVGCTCVYPEVREQQKT
ncbi:interleukin-17A-like [Anomaloglossus baeobatrachus]|uniref:interleukin-17A-like n=1 Tax=Anomaloglossus baeobatrachus TaxID=238106 RepID=UPI003F4F4FD9